jgi:hypothetical protein
MKSLRNIMAALIVTSTALTVPAMTGCYASEGTYVIAESPPPPRDEVVVYRPGHVWVHGRWTRPGRHWVWRSGYYARERPNHVYVEGRWERRNRGYVWVDGSWRSRGVVIRERR